MGFLDAFRKKKRVVVVRPATAKRVRRPPSLEGETLAYLKGLKKTDSRRYDEIMGRIAARRLGLETDDDAPRSLKSQIKETVELAHLLGLSKAGSGGDGLDRLIDRAPELARSITPVLEKLVLLRAAPASRPTPPATANADPPALALRAATADSGSSATSL
ncbi:MAG: hypothetical protein ACREOS_09485, partial [Candidatus Dormibacteraceae bacterium]